VVLHICTFKFARKQSFFENKVNGLLQFFSVDIAPTHSKPPPRGVRVYISAQDRGSVPLAFLVLSVHNGSVVFSSAGLAAGCDVATATERPQEKGASEAFFCRQLGRRRVFECH